MTRPKQIIYPLRYFGAGTAQPGRANFTQRLGRFLGDGVHVFPIGRARAGIWLLTKLSAKGPRNRVIMSPYTIPDLVNMVRFAGGEPVFVDFAPNSTNVDVEIIKPLLNKLVCCVFLTHYHFNQASIVEIRTLCRERDILLFDDCALALGGAVGNARIGTISDASVFSFSGFKPLNYFWGGAVSTTSSEFAVKIASIVEAWPRLRLRDYAGQLRKVAKYDLATRQPLYSMLTFPILRYMGRKGGSKEILPLVRVESETFERSLVSRPSLSAERQWDSKLDKVDAITDHRRRIAQVYDQELGDRVVGSDTPLHVRQRSCLVNYPIAVDPQRRTTIFHNILARGFDVGLSLYPNVQELAGFKDVRGETQNVSRLVRSVITLPTHPKISVEYATRLADAVSQTII